MGMGAKDLIGLGIGAYNAYQGSKAQGKADKLTQQALDMAMQQYADRLPFRNQALAMMGQIEGDTGLPADFGINTGNPYARQRVNTAMQGLTPLTGTTRRGVPR